MFSVLLMILCLYALFDLSRCAYRLREGLCSTCGFPTNADSSCSECATQAHSSQDLRRRRLRRKGALWAAICLAVIGIELLIWPVVAGPILVRAAPIVPTNNNLVAGFMSEEVWRLADRGALSKSSLEVFAGRVLDNELPVAGMCYPTGDEEFELRLLSTVSTMALINRLLDHYRGELTITSSSGRVVWPLASSRSYASSRKPKAAASEFPLTMTMRVVPSGQPMSSEAIITRTISKPSP